jgi:hypothetical protein
MLPGMKADELVAAHRLLRDQFAAQARECKERTNRAPDGTELAAG